MKQYLCAGDLVDIVAPSSGLSKERLETAKKCLEAWGLVPRVNSNIFGADPIYANSKELRLKDLVRTLTAQDSKAVWCLRGGTGATQLIPSLLTLLKPQQEKIFVGFSDATSLHILLHQHWGWTPLHGPVLSQIAEEKIAHASIQLIKDIVFGDQSDFILKGLTPLNEAAKKSTQLQSEIVGGNLSLLQSSLGTSWQLKTENKVFFCEDVNEEAYRCAERLEHLRQNGLFDKCSAVILCDFTFDQENSLEQELYPGVLEQFAKDVSLPVLRVSGVGHGHVNQSMPFGGKCHLNLGSASSLKVFYQ